MKVTIGILAATLLASPAIAEDLYEQMNRERREKSEYYDRRDEREERQQERRRQMYTSPDRAIESEPRIERSNPIDTAQYWHGPAGEWLGYTTKDRQGTHMWGTNGAYLGTIGR